jgi:hypothetical protein
LGAVSLSYVNTSDAAGLLRIYPSPLTFARVAPSGLILLFPDDDVKAL